MLGGPKKPKRGGRRRSIEQVETYEPMQLAARPSIQTVSDKLSHFESYPEGHPIRRLDALARTLDWQNDPSAAKKRLKKRLDIFEERGLITARVKSVYRSMVYAREGIKEEVAA